jgi:hypothetical protein
MTNEIDWTNLVDDSSDEEITVDLKKMEIGTEATVHFESVRGVSNGMIVATVASEELEGTTMWLRGKFGPQNGLLSLVKAASGGDMIEGNTFTLAKIPSEKSPVGYAYRWTTA